jgi:hypothetical protein
MNIDVTINGKPFSAIESGETFYYEPSGTMWIKLDGQLLDIHNATYNAVALDNGTPSYFDDDDEITIVPTKLVNA